MNKAVNSLKLKLLWMTKVITQRRLKEIIMCAQNTHNRNQIMRWQLSRFCGLGRMWIDITCVCFPSVLMTLACRACCNINTQTVWDVAVFLIGFVCRCSYTDLRMDSICLTVLCGCKNGIRSKCNLRNTSCIYDSLHICFCLWHGWGVMKPWPVLLVYCVPVYLLLTSITSSNSFSYHTPVFPCIKLLCQCEFATKTHQRWITALAWLQGQSLKVTGKAPSCPDSEDMVRCADVEHDLRLIPASQHVAHYLP